MPQKKKILFYRLQASSREIYSRKRKKKDAVLSLPPVLGELFKSESF